MPEPQTLLEMGDMQKLRENELLKAFNLMTVEEKDFLIKTAVVMTRGRPVYKPKLVLVGGGSTVSQHSVFQSRLRGT